MKLHLFVCWHADSGIETNNQVREAGRKMGIAENVPVGDLLTATQFAELLPDAVFFRREGIIIHCNAAAVRQYRAPSAADLIGTPSLDWLHPDEVEGALGDRRLLNVRGEPTRTVPRRQIRYDGTEFIGDASLALIEEGPPPVYVVIIHDVTEYLRLKDSEQRLHDRIADAVDAIDGSIIQFDADDRFVYCNQSFRDDFAAVEHLFNPGTPFETITRAILESGIVPTAVGRVEEYLADIKNFHKHGGEPREAPLANGRWVLTNEYRTRDGGTLVLRTDITERKLAGEAQRRSQQMFRETFENSGIGMSITDMDNRFVEVNDAYCRMVGRSREEIVGADIVTVNHPDDMTSINELRAGLTDGRNIGEPKAKRFLRPDGSIVWSEVSRALIRDDTGEPLYIIGQSRDITAQLTADRALHRSEERYRELFEWAPSAFVNLDPDDGRLIHFNHEMAELLGYQEEELSCLTIFDLYAATADGAPLALDFARDLILRARSGEEIRKIEFPLRRKSGETVWVLFSMRPGVDDSGQTTELRCVATDITELITTDRALAAAKLEAEDANQIKSMFLANVSHELRTPLNAIIGFSEALNGGIFGGMANENQEEYVSLINQSGLHLLELINDVLDISAIESRQLELNEEVTELKGLLDESVHLAEGATKSRRVTIQNGIPEPGSSINVDRRRFNQILVNLLSNALKFSPAPAPVRLVAKETPEGELWISVEDEGPGMTGEETHQAMSMFGQIERHQVPGVRGTGLGLPLTKELVELHGGRLSIESEPGAGTTISIRLPAERVIRAG